MGILKIEMEVPDFKDAIELSLILKKDGEVITTSESLKKDSENPIWRSSERPTPTYDPGVWKQTPPSPSKFIVGDDPTQKGPYCGDVVPTQSSGGSGNFMNINIDDL